MSDESRNSSQPQVTTRTTSLTVQLVVVQTPVPVTEVVARLEREINRQGSASIISQMKAAKTREDIEAIVNSITGAKNFLYFQDYLHSNWLNVFFNVTNTPYTHTYVIGNPLIARSIMQHDLRAALHIPLRLLVREKENCAGTEIMYHLPSSVMVLNNDPNIRSAAEALDKKLAQLVADVARADHDPPSLL